MAKPIFPDGPQMASPRIDGVTLRRLRMTSGLTQEQLADRAHVSVRTILNAQAGREISLSSAEAIARALNVRPDELFAAADVRARRDPADGNDDGVSVDRAGIDRLLSAGKRSSASCSAYLAGDLSVLVTKMAYAIPVDAKVHVSIRDDEVTSVRAFFPCARDRWKVDPDVSPFVTRLVSKLLADEATRKHFPKLKTALRVTLAFEVPADVSLYEENAVAWAFATAILDDDEEGTAKEREFDVARLAAAFVAGWYPDVAYGSLLASSHDPAEYDNRVLFFDRTAEPRHVDLLKLYEGEFDVKDEDGDYQRNIYPPAPFWTVEDRYFSVSQLSVWWDGKPAISSRSRSRGAPISELRSLPMRAVVDRMCQSIDVRGEGGEEQFGMLMQVHHLLLASAGFVDRDTSALIARINGLSDVVLGAKLAGGRGRGAIVVLSRRGVRADELKEKMNGLGAGLRALEDFRSRVVVLPGTS